MANRKHSDPHRYATCPGVRPGLKREFAFALKSQGEVPNYRYRTRSGKSPVAASAAILSRGGKKQKMGDDREKLSAVITKETDRPSKEIVAVGIPTTDVGNYVGGVPISTLSKEEFQKDDINLVSTVLADGKGGHEGVTISVDKPKNSLVPHPLALCSEVSNSSLENGSVAEHSAVVDGKRGFKVGNSLAEKPARRFTRSALKLLPATAAPENKQEGNPGEVKPKKKFTQGTSMLLVTTPSTSFRNVKRNIWEANHLPFQQENFVKLPIIADNCRRVGFESGHLDESIKAGLEGLVPVTSMSGVDEDNKRNDVVPLENTITNIPIRRRKRSFLKTTNEKSAVAYTCTHPSVKFTESKGSKRDNNTLRRALKKKMELKMSKKITLTKPPSNIRELLGTGMLEGLPVRYISCLGKSIERQGIVRGNGILCSCTSCRGKVVVSAHLFEIHAGSTKKHPSNFIYLQNGKSIREVLKMCNGASMDRLEAVIQDAIGPLPPKKLSVCQKCDGIACTKKFPLRCKSCSESSYQQAVQISSHGMTNSAKLVGRALEPVTSDGTGSNISSQKKNGDRKLTRKDLGLHKLVFMDDILPQGTEVGYYLRGKRLLVGYIKDSGIFCRCCNCVLSPSQFEAHAGQASRRKPYNNIYTSNGVSLHELSVSLSKGRKLSASENDDLCGICADGGNLLLCDLCPRAFHKECVGLSYIPDGDWFCQYCQNLQQKDKCLASNYNAIAAGRVAGVDPIEQIIKRCIRIVGTPENNTGVCALCREHDFRRSGFDRRTVIICDQCEIEYHVGCLKDHGMADLKKLPQGEWFCRPECSSIHSALYKLLGRGPETLEELDANTIRTKLDKKGLSKDAAADIRWKLLSGRSDSADSKLLLSQAVSIFRESFDPIIDPISGRDLIPFMVYGRNMRDQDYGGVYCMVLTQKSSVISAGLLRVLGCEVAELPLVATKRVSQGLGYFQSLFSCIERLLKSLKVKHFVLPAADDAVSMWTNKFGFTKLTQTQLLEHVKSAQPIVFQGTSMLHKTVDSPREPPPVVNDEERRGES